MSDNHDPQFEGTEPVAGKMWPRIWRGMKLRCPNCGQGKLFRAYLKPVDHCAECGVAWGDVRADLAPAWAAMTLAAHLVVLIWHFFLWDTALADWQLISILCTLAAGISLLALPPMKGLFMAIIWAKGTTDS